MITVKEILRKFPGRTVTQIVDYDDSGYVVCAVKDLDEPAYDGFWYVDKKEGRIAPFTPAADLEKFFDAVDKRTVFKK